MSLIGVVGTTVWSNRKADERRRADQASEDARRREERDFKTWTDEVIRERREVGECVTQIRRSSETEYQTVREGLITYTSRIAKDDKIAVLEFNALRTQSRAEFYSRAVDATERLVLELTQPEVREKAIELRQILKKDAEKFRISLANAQNLQRNFSENSPNFSEEINRAINELLDAAFEHLHLGREFKTVVASD